MRGNGAASVTPASSSRPLHNLRSSRFEAFAVERAIAADPDLSLLGWVAASQQPTDSLPLSGDFLLWESSINEQIWRRCCKCCTIFVTPCSPLTKTASVFHAWASPTLKERSPGRNVPTGVICVSPLCFGARFLFREQLRPSRHLAFFLPGTWEKKAVGQRILAPEDEWAFAGCKPADLTFSPQRDFSRSLHPPWPASLCGCERSGPFRGERRQRVVLQCTASWAQITRSWQAYTTTPPPPSLRSSVHPAQTWMPIFSASCLALWRSWVWNGLPQRNRPVATWMTGSCRGAARPLVNELYHSFLRSTTRLQGLGVHPTRPAYVPLLPPPSLRSTAQKKKVMTACLHWSLPAHSHLLEGKSRSPV